MYLAHGLGGRSDLPVPLWMAVYAGTGAVVFSFVVLNAFWGAARFSAAGGRPLSPAGQRLLGSRVLRRSAQAAGLAGGIALLLTAWVGPDDVSRNPAPTWFFVWFWVGLLPLSLLFGPVLRAVSPLRTVAHWLGGGVGWRRLPDRVGMWPAVVSLLTFLWLELVYDHSSDPHTVAVFLTAYAVVHIGCGTFYGPGWFERAEGFEVYSTLVGRLAVLARRDERMWELRNPLRGLASTVPRAGLVAVVCVLLGSTAFDGLSRTSWWKELTLNAPRPAYLLSGTVGLATAIGLVALVYAAAARLTRPYAPRAESPSVAFVHSLVPIVCGYTVAHYFSFAVFQGQAGLILASDPLGRGWDLFGTAGGRIDYAVVSTRTIALVQVGAIVLGHLVGVVAAHDRALTVFPRRRSRTGQYPLLAAMVGFTMAGIALVVGS